MAYVKVCSQGDIELRSAGFRPSRGHAEHPSTQMLEFRQDFTLEASLGWAVYQPAQLQQLPGCIQNEASHVASLPSKHG